MIYDATINVFVTFEAKTPEEAKSILIDVQHALCEKAESFPGVHMAGAGSTGPEVDEDDGN